MCLLTTQQVPQIAEEDITCYKVLLHLDDKLYSYYYNAFEWEMDKVHFTTLQEKRSRRTVHQGFHSYKDLHSTLVLMTRAPFTCLVVECIIPKGTEYYVGKDGDKLEGYASEKLKPIKVITRKELFAKIDGEYPYKKGQTIMIESKRIPSSPGVYKITDIYIDRCVKLELKSTARINNTFSRSYLMDTDFEGNPLNKNESIIAYGIDPLTNPETETEYKPKGE